MLYFFSLEISLIIVVGELPKKCLSSRSTGLELFVFDIILNFPSFVTFPTSYIGALSLSQIFLSISNFFSLTSSPILSCDSFPTISLNDSVESPTGSLSIFIIPPEFSTNSVRQFR